MTPEMSLNEMLNLFVFIAKGSRVIDRRMANWGQLYWLPEQEIEHMVFSLVDLENFFAPHRTDRVDPFKEWLTHRYRRAVPTLGDALKFADAAARGQIAPYIDIEALVRSGLARNASSGPMLSWAERLHLSHQAVGGAVV